MATRPPTATTTNRIIHAALVTGVVLFAAVSQVVSVRAHPALPAAFIYIPFAVGAALFGAALILRNRLPALDSATSEDDWWRKNAMRALVVWSLIESGSLFGTIIALVSGNRLPLTVTAVGILLFLLTAPGRLVAP